MHFWASPTHSSVFLYLFSLNFNFINKHISLQFDFLEALPFPPLLSSVSLHCPLCSLPSGLVAAPACMAACMVTARPWLILGLLGCRAFLLLFPPS